MGQKAQRILKTMFKTILVLITTVVFLLLLVTTLLLIPTTGNFITKKVVNKVEKSLHTNIELESIRFIPTGAVILNNFYVEGTGKDTLVAADRLKVSVKLLDLLNNKLYIEHVELENATLKLIRSANDSLFNFTFSEPKAKQNDTISSDPMEIFVGSVELDNIRFLMDDALSGNRFKVRLGHLDVSMDKLDIENNDFGIKDFLIANADVSIQTGPSYASEDTTASSLMVQLRKTGEIKQSTVRFLGASGPQMQIENINLILKDNEFNLVKKEIRARLLELNNTAFTLRTTGDNAGAASEQNTTTEINLPDWNVKIGELLFENNTLQFTSESANTLLEQLSLNIEDIYLNNPNAGFQINALSGKYNNQHQIDDLKAGLALKKQSLRLTSLSAESGGSRVNADASISFEDINTAIHHPGSIHISNLEQNADILMNDLARIAPTLKDSFPALMTSGKHVFFAARLSGKTDSLKIERLKLTSDGLLDLKANGSLMGLSQENVLNADLTIERLWARYAGVKPYLGSVPVSQNLSLPDTLQIAGSVKGSLQNLASDLSIHTSQGNIEADLKLITDTVNARNDIYAALTIPSYQLGILLNNPDTIGQIAARAEVSISTINGKLNHINGNVAIDSVGFSDYQYKDITLMVSEENDTVFADVSIDDPNVRLDTRASYFAIDTLQDITLKLNLNYLSLQALNLRDEDIRMSGRIEGHTSGTIPNNFTAHLVAQNMIVNRNNTVYYPDSVAVNAVVGDTSNISILSPFLQAEYSGTIRPTALAKAVKSQFPTFLGLIDSTSGRHLSDREFTLTLSLEQDPVYSQLLLPQLVTLHETKINASLKNDEGLLLEASVPLIEYGSIMLDSVYLNLGSVPEKLDYELGFNQIKSGSISLPQSKISGSTKDDVLVNTLDLPETTKTSKYFIQAEVSTTESDNMKVHIYSDSLILNRNAWIISDDNAIVFTKEQTEFNNFSLNRGSDTLRISSTVQESERGTLFSFVNFNLRTLASMANYAGEAPSAKLNGTVELINSGETTGLRSDLSINDLELFGNPLFKRLNLKASQENDKAYNLNLTMKNNSTVSSVSGTYKTGDESYVDMKIDLNRFSISPFEPLLSEQFQTLQGSLSGDMSLSGSFQKPSLNGTLTFDSLAVNPVAINSPLYMNNASILVDDNTLQFNNTTIYDASKNKAVLNGNVAYSPDKTTFNLSFKANDFMFLNKPANDESLYYGTLITDVDATLKGNLDKPVVNMKTVIKEGSSLHITVPESSKDPGEDEDIAEFVVEDSSLVTVTKQELTTASNMPDVSANVSFQDYIPVTILVDPVSGEELKVKGKGDLSLSLKGNTPPSLSGRYTISSGSYTLLLYNVFKRTFSIRSGSYLLWSGDVLKPTVDITAAYDLRTSPLGLVATDLNAGSDDLSQYRKTMPFSVVMNLEGDLLSPDINFDIETAPGNADALVSSRLSRLNSDESAVNKQVLSLLVFKTFMNQNVGGTDVAYKLNNTARTGLSNILSNSFNQFAQNYIKGVNLTLDVESRAGYSGSTSGNTDLVFGASKSLFNDRLTVEVGSSINVENEDNRPPASDGLAGDFLIEYKITKDGFVNVQAFRSSEYEDVLVGDVTKTGIALKLSKAFNSFGELFKRNKKKEKAGVKANE